MSKKKDLIQIYNEILDTAWMTANEKGIISRFVDPETKETSVTQIEDNTDNKKKKIGVLPTKENLVGLDSDTYLVLHPLNENPSKPASPIVDLLRRMMSVRMNWILSTMLPELLAFAASPAKHDLLKPEQLDILTTLADVGKDFASKFIRLIEASKTKNGHFGTIVSTYLTRGGVVNGTTFHRAAIVKFTLYDEIVKAGTDNVVLGVKLTKKEREVFKKLFERVIPGIDDLQHYNTGSNANVAPFMDAMLNTFLKLFSATNDVVENYQVIFSTPELLKVNLDWSDELLDINNLSSIVRLVPPQRGNEGDDRVEDSLRKANEADMSKFKSTAEKNAAGVSFKPQPKAEPFHTTGPASFTGVVQQPIVNHQVPPWENLPVTGFNQSQSTMNQNGPKKVSFGALQIAQQSPAAGGFNNNQQRATFFGGQGNFGGSRSGF